MALDVLAPLRRVLAAAALALLLPEVAVAAPPAEDPRARAEALAGDGRHADAARLWETIATEASDDRPRLGAYLHAIDAWEALAATGDAGARQEARALLLRAIKDPWVDERARQELQAELDRIEALIAEGRPRVALLDPDGALPVERPRRDPGPVDRPRRSPLTIAGVSTLALAAPALGGFVYAALADRAIARDANEQRDTLAAGGEIDPATIPERRAEAVLLRDLEIGLGVTTAILVGTGVGLIAAGRRSRRAARSVSILPHAGRGLGGLVLSGRF